MDSHFRVTILDDQYNFNCRIIYCEDYIISSFDQTTKMLSSVRIRKNNANFAFDLKTV